MPAYYGLASGTVPGVGPAGVPLSAIQVPTDMKPGDSAWLFGIVPAANAGGASDALILGEQPAVGTSSVPICITPPVQGGGPPMMTFEFSFYATGTLLPADPGAFEIDIQEADTDADDFYILPSTAAYKVTAYVAGTFKARVDLSPTGGKLMRVKLAARANAVDFVAKASRIA